MFKKCFLSLILFFCCFNYSFAKEVDVVIEPTHKITTSNPNLREGDDVDFIAAQDVFLNSKLYIKKGSPAVGIVTSIENNDFLYKEASLYAENFKVENIDGKMVKLTGIIYKTGNKHQNITQLIPAALWVIRGGEVQIKPQKDTFTLFLEEI